MALCVSCGKELKEGARFCPFCGAEQPVPAAPPVPEPAAPPAPVRPSAPAVQTSPAVPASAVPSPLPSPKKKSKAPLILGIVAGAAVLIAGLALLVVFVILPRFSPNVPGESAETAAEGKYYAVSATAFDQETRIDGEWIELDPEGKGTFCISGQEHSLTWELNGEAFSGSVTFLGLKNVLTGTLKDGVLNIRYGNYSYVMKRDAVPSPDTHAAETDTSPGSEPAPETETSSEEGAPLDLDLIARYEGDWVGAVQFYNCSGAYAAHDFVLSDAILRLSFAPDGSVTPYLRINLEGFENRSGFDSSEEANNFRDLAARLDPGTGSLFLSGHFFSGSLGDETCAVAHENGSLTISMTVTAGDGSFDIFLIFRRLGDTWSSEDDPRLTDDGADYYSRLGLPEIAEEFKLDPALIPEASEIADYPDEGASPG